MAEMETSAFEGDAISHFISTAGGSQWIPDTVPTSGRDAGFLSWCSRPIELVAPHEKGGAHKMNKKRPNTKQNLDKR